ncbi:MAG: substrate-binding domain-containing protein [Spirochaetes bacterium]|nr:substrate-binding domain-containing protein [Spirochaetota bacterium]MBU1081122.1 substrate-binding domain-containing protein [Spirochaetota bacterium]
MNLSTKRTSVRAAAALAVLLLGAAQAFALGGKEQAQAAPAGRPTPANPRVRLATTTSTENSGLLTYLLPFFTEDTGYTVDVVAVGTGAALKLGENADADVLLVHARAQEDAFMKAGHGATRRDVMYNDFIVVGPASDPAGLKGSADSAAAFAKLAAAQAQFVSRGDKSGTHVKELDIWKAAKIVPSGSWYKEAGQGMEQVIIMADGLQGYALADRGTWIAVKDKTSLAVCYEGDAGLFNPYGVITVNPAKNVAINAFGAKAFLEWLTSERGQGLIASYKLGGQTLFFPNYKP